MKFFIFYSEFPDFKIFEKTQSFHIFFIKLLLVFVFLMHI